MNDITVLIWSFKDFYKQALEDEGVRVKGIYRLPSNFLIACIRSLWFKLKLPFPSLWFNPKLRDQNGTFVLFEAMVHPEFLKYMRKKSPEARLICWLRTHVSPSGKVSWAGIRPNAITESGWELWTFNPADAKKYEMKLNYNPIFSEKFYERFSNYYQLQKQYDLVFIGKEKGRKTAVETLRRQTETYRLRWFVYYVADNFYRRWFRRNKNCQNNKMLSYSEYTRIHAVSTAVLEIIPEESEGYTARVMDAMYFGQKLVTNNAYLRKADFYHPDNIFILGKDDISSLPDFLKRPVHTVRNEVIQHYSISNWLLRFLDDTPEAVD